MPKRTVPRFIDPANIQIGDVIRVSWEAQGIQHTRTARVYRRIDDGPVRELYTAEGTQIMSWTPGGKNARVTLLEVMPQQTETLDDLLSAIDEKWSQVS